MRNLLYAATAIAALAALPSAAEAAVIHVGACVPASYPATCAPLGDIISGPSGTLLTVPATTIGNFQIGGTASATTTLNGIVFDTQTLQVSTTAGGGLIDIFFTVDGIASAGVPVAFMTTFTSNQQNATTHSVTESSWLSNTNGKFDLGLGTNLATATLTSAVLQTAGPFTTIATPNALAASLTEMYQIELLGCGGQTNGQCTANLTIDLNAAPVPEPASLALLGVSLLGLGFVANRKRSV